MKDVWWMKWCSLRTLPLLLTQMHNNRAAQIYVDPTQRSHTKPGVFLECFDGMGPGLNRLNLPSFPRDSSSFWIWFSRKNMATANASSARSCNLGGIMTLSSPIKSSREGFGQSMLRGGHTENAHTATTAITKRLSVCAWPCLPLYVWISPDVQILKCEVFTLGFVISSSKIPKAKRGKALEI